MSSSEVQWLRPVTLTEELMELGHRNRLYLTCYTLHLASCQPLHHDLVYSGLTHLFRKVEVLRVCLGQRDGQLWLRQMNGCNLDFKIVEQRKTEEVEEELTHYIYNTSEGPMWCVRLLALPPTPSSTDLDSIFSHNYALMLGIHHSLADGFTNINICNLVHTILDDMVAGRPVNDEQQVGKLVGDEQTQKLYEEQRQKLLGDPELKERVRKEFQDGADTRPLFLDAFPVSGRTDVKTCFVNIQFDKNLTYSFRRKCKEEGVTLHSGLVGIINATLINLLNDHCEVPHEINFRAGHDINLRRYYEGDTTGIYGNHIPTFGFKTSFKTSETLMSNFWPTVKEFHKKLHSHLIERRPLQVVVLKLMEKSKSEILDGYFTSHGTPDSYYTVSNMGDVTPLFTGEGDCVKVVKLTRLSSIRCMNNFICFYAHSLNGRLDLTMGFSNRFLDHKFAKGFMDMMSVNMTTLSSL
ncbi:hypothetical protein OTU49_017080 [Cherax quadricarinatus]|uniref:Condensation domain-containing protein n=2 Tax=Cherax quadricarinatus TaxID=27406 RepID=A0AAW0Y3B4_CHEQU